MNKKFVFSLTFIFFFSFGYAQFAYRLSADIFTKTRMPDSTFQISKGKIYYDQNYKKIIFNFTFPEKELVVLFDTMMYSYRADTLFSKTKNLLIPDQSLFHFILAGKMENYGLDQANYEMKGFERKNDMIITTWIPTDFLKKMISKVLVATKNKLLYSVTMIDANGKVISRQILKNYKLIQGLDFPSEILIATYLEKGSIYQIITMGNVILNEPENNSKYDHDL
jgi:hypothetical protein